MLFQNGVISLRPAAGNRVKIAIAGDCCPRNIKSETGTTAPVETYIQEGHGKDILASVQPILDSADLRIIQWETVITDRNTPIVKAGPNLSVASGTARLLTDGKFDIALLANNHTGDFGPDEVMRTIGEIRKLGVQTVGAGKNAAEAKVPLHFEKNGLRFSLINGCEMEFGTALPDRAGANAYDEYEFRTQIAAERAAGFLVIVVIHGGNEYNPIPSPLMKKRYRSFADAGAALVMNIHTHCPQGIEVHNGIPIIYCPGNFFFPDTPFDPASFWWSGYLPRIVFDASGVTELEIFPYFFSPDPWKITLLSGAARKWYLAYLEKISGLMHTDGDRLYDIWTAFKAGMPFIWIENAPIGKLRQDPEDQSALKGLPYVRHMLTCQAHNELARNVMLLIERKRFQTAKEHIPELNELRIARFHELI